MAADLLELAYPEDHKNNRPEIKYDSDERDPVEQAGRCQPVREGFKCLKDTLAASGCKDQEMDPAVKIRSMIASPIRTPTNSITGRRGPK